MKHTLSLCAIVAIAVFSIVTANSQTATKHYEKDGLAFNYPEGWELTDSTSLKVRTVNLTRKGGPPQIAVKLQEGPISSCDFQAQRKEIADALTQEITSQIHGGDQRDALPVTTQLGGADIEGTQLQGTLNRKRVSASVYSGRLNRRFVSLIYILGAKDDNAEVAWRTVRTTLTIEPPPVGVLTRVKNENADAESSITSGVLNGRALALPRPEYPKIARSAHASGLVTVQVTIDEAGNVIAAHAVAGNPLLHVVSVAAAKSARFSTTKLCGEPVRVAGVITYNFVAQ